MCSAGALDYTFVSGVNAKSSWMTETKKTSMSSLPPDIRKKKKDKKKQFPSLPSAAPTYVRVLVLILEDNL